MTLDDKSKPYKEVCQDDNSIEIKEKTDSQKLENKNGIKVAPCNIIDQIQQ